MRVAELLLTSGTIVPACITKTTLTFCSEAADTRRFSTAAAVHVGAILTFVLTTRADRDVALLARVARTLPTPVA